MRKKVHLLKVEAIKSVKGRMRNNERSRRDPAKQVGRTPPSAAKLPSHLNRFPMNLYSSPKSLKLTSSLSLLKVFQFPSNISKTPLAPKKLALMVLFLLLKTILFNPSNSSKAIGGGGFLGTILTTVLSTCGGGLKEFLETAST